MANSQKPPTLVVLQLTGGNDALNTVIPHGDPLYWDNRPNVRINAADILKIDNSYGFHPSMAALKPFWDRGKMAVVMGVGYEDPSYSHFRSADIWYTAEPEKVIVDGWLGKVVREFDPKAENVVTAVNFGRGLPRALSLAGVPVGSVAQLDSYGLLTSLSSPRSGNRRLRCSPACTTTATRTRATCASAPPIRPMRRCATWARPDSTPRRAPRS